MSIFISVVTDDVLTKITNFEDPHHMWLHLQNQYEVIDTT